MPKFQVGDKLRIRSWESMKDEFGEVGPRSSPRISCAAAFTNAMRRLCGKDFTVKEIESSPGRYDIYHSEEGIEVDNEYFFISEDMLECADGYEFDIANLSDFNAFIFG